MSDSRLVYRLLLAVDIQGYSKRDAREQLLAQRELSEALDRAAKDIGLDRRLWDKQVGGDGELAVLPEDVDPAPVVGDLPGRLAAALGARGRGPGDRHRLRVRLAMHHGTLTEGPFGPAGEAPVVVQRLLDAAALRKQLIRHPGHDVAYAISAKLYEDVVRTGFTGVPAEAFQAIRVRAKGTTYHGYMHTGRAGAGLLNPDGGTEAGPGDGAGPGDDDAGGRVLPFPALAVRQAR